MSQPIAYRWKPIEDLPDDFTTLASGELRALSELWLEQRGVLESSDALKRFNERLRREWAIETGIIERIYTLDRGTTELLIERGIDASLISHEATDKDPNLVAEIIRDQESAIDLLFAFIKGHRTLSTSFIKELHALITRHQETVTARDQFGTIRNAPLLRGEWKRLPNNPVRPDGSLHEYCPPEQVASEMDRLLQLHREHAGRGVPPEVEAAWLHHRFTQIHPFQDGNGRVVRALSSLVFIKAGWFPLVVTRDHRERYIDALERADLGDLHPLVQLFVELERLAFVGALGIVGEIRREGGRLDQVIASIGEMLTERREERRREWDHAKEIANKVADRARSRLVAVADQLGQELSRASGGYTVFVDAEPNGGKRWHWFQWQTRQAARKLDYFANLKDYSAWVRLHLQGETAADVLVSLTGIGREFRGLVGVSLCFFRWEETGDGERRVADVTAAADELFQINYKEPEEAILDRFDRWLDRGMVRALETWRQTL